MRLAEFIEQNLASILDEWGVFAQTRIPAAATMDAVELRDHAAQMLLAIVADMRRSQSEAQRETKSKGLADPSPAEETPASEHGRIRHLSGFDLIQIVSEFRAMRAAILRLWRSRSERVTGDDVDDLMRLNESIDQALAESVASYSAKMDESRDTFLAVLGHDLRGPLSSLSNCIELQATVPQSPALRERTSQIARRSVVSMKEMITDLLEYTRTRLGRGIDVVLAPGDIGDICEESLEQMRVAYPDTVFELELSGDLSTRFDAARIRQVLINLLTNAVQHGDRSLPIDLTAVGEPHEIVLAIRNHGATIPPNALQVIFNPLVQVATSASAPHERPSTSLGLGLYIAREIVIAHGGKIAVTSSDEEGTTFELRVPRVVDPA
jgi:signal transduction histidine kinase